MASNKGTTGRGKKSSTPRTTPKQPIPIDSGTALATSGPDTPRMQAYVSIETEIRLRAYELYEERGRQDGMENEDWMRAEAEILARHNSKEKSA